MTRVDRQRVDSLLRSVERGIRTLRKLSYYGGAFHELSDVANITQALLFRAPIYQKMRGWAVPELVARKMKRTGKP